MARAKNRDPAKKPKRPKKPKKLKKPKKPRTRAKKRATNNIRTFHHFPHLPAEIQLMVWSFWRQSQPIIRHHFSLRPDGRHYAAIDREKRLYVTTTARSAEPGQYDPLDPMEHKIRFTNSVISINDPSQDLSHLHNLSKVNFLKMAPAFTWVNFEHHVFVVQNLGYRLPGYLRFLFRQIGARAPPDIDSNHWSMRIQRLAIIWTSERHYLDELDARAFTQLSGLRTVYIVSNARRYAPEEFDLDGFHDVGLENPLPPHRIPRMYRKYHTSHDLQGAQAAATQLSGIFESQRRTNVKVRVVLDEDAYAKWPHS